MATKKIFVENEELQATVDALSVVDGTVELLLGAQAAGENVLCMASSISTGGEQIQVQFAALKPTDYTDKYLFGVFSGKELLGLLRGVLALKDRVYFEQSGKGWFIGVGQDVKLPISTLAEKPQKIALNKTEQLFQAQVSMSSFADALRGGSLMTATGEDDRGLSNAVMRVIPNAITEEKALSGSLGIYSSEGHATSKAAVSCVMVNTVIENLTALKTCFESTVTHVKEFYGVQDEEMDTQKLVTIHELDTTQTEKLNGISSSIDSMQRIVDYFGKDISTLKDACENIKSLMNGEEIDVLLFVKILNDSLKGIEKVLKETYIAYANGYVLAIPKKAANNLCKLLAGKDGTAALGVDKTHVMVAIGKRIMYTFTQGAKYHEVVFKTDEWDKANKPIVYVLDNEELKQKIGLLTSVADVQGAKKPIRLVMEEGKDLLIQLAGSDAEIRTNPVSSKMEGKASVCLSGKMVCDVLSTLKRGNVRISFLVGGDKAATNPVGFSNGDLSGNAENSVVSFLLPVKDIQEKKEETKAEEESADAADTTEATEE